MNRFDQVDRREMMAGSLAALSLVPFSSNRFLPFRRELKLKYIVGSSMYGYTKLEEILPEVSLTGAAAIDIWPKVHGDQREQLNEMGEERFVELLESHELELGCITQYALGPYGLADELKLANRLGCSTIVTSGKGPKGLRGDELKQAVSAFAEAMKPHLENAEEQGVDIAIENHSGNVMESPDAMKWLMDLRSSPRLGIAFAPYHLPQDPELLAELVRDLGDSIKMFYAWQHGMGCMKAQPKEQELLQMPGRGELDFGPMIKALTDIEYEGWTEIFMHPFPRGIPILEPTRKVTDEINRSRDYLEGLIEVG